MTARDGLGECTDAVLVEIATSSIGTEPNENMSQNGYNSIELLTTAIGTS